MKLFVLKDEAFAESESLYLHDVAAFVDEVARRIYFWRGPKSPKKLLEVAEKSWQRLAENPRYAAFKFLDASENPDFELNRTINSYLGEHAEMEKEKEMRNYATYGVMSLVLVAAMFAIFALTNSLLAFGIDQNTQGFFTTSLPKFSKYFAQARLFTLVALGLLLATFLLCLKWVREGWLLVTSLLSIATAVGWYYYLTYDIYLFDFMNENVFSNEILLKPTDFVIFTVLNFAVLAVMILPIGIRVIVYYQSTIVAEKERATFMRDLEKIGTSLASRFKVQPHVRYGTPQIVDLRRKD